VGQPAAVPGSERSHRKSGKKIEYPRYATDATFRKAPKSRKAAEEQIPLSAGEIEEPF